MRIFVMILLVFGYAGPAFCDAAINAAVSPGARTGRIGVPLSAFALIQNFGDEVAGDCRIELNQAFSGDVPVSFSFQTTDAGNQLTGSPNVAVDIAAGAVQGFLIELTGSAALTGRDLGFDFVCGSIRAPLFAGVNTLRLTLSDQDLPDLIPIAVSLSGDGVMRVAEAGGASAFATAVINIGGAGNVRVRANAGSYQWPMQMQVCETGADGLCLIAPTAFVDVHFDGGQSRTFSVFGFASDRLGVPFMPELARSFLQIEQLDGNTLAASSVAISAPEPALELAMLDLDAARQWAAGDGSTALLIQRDGALLLEEYWGAGGPQVAERIWSGSKSFSCALAAAAADAGILNVDEFASSAIGPWQAGGAAPDAALKSLIRGRDLISLTSGLRGRVTPAGVPNFSNTYDLAIHAPQDLEPDRQALYGSTGFHSFTALFELKTGGQIVGDTLTGGTDPVAFIEANVLHPIGAQVAAWVRDANGKPDFAAGAWMTARNWIKYGQLLINDGNWQGAALLSPASVRKCRQYYTPAMAVYGQSFWLNRPVGDTWDPAADDIPFGAFSDLAQFGQILPSAPADHFAALGFGNMQLHMIPSERLVVVKYGGSNDQNELFTRLFAGAFDQ